MHPSICSHTTPLEMLGQPTSLSWIGEFCSLTAFSCDRCSVAVCKGREWANKVCEVREKMNEKKATGLVVTALDEIAWLLNLRGCDISYNPVFFAYVIVTMDSVMFVSFVLSQSL